MEQLQFNLQDVIDNPSTAGRVVAEVQKAFTDLSNASLAAINSAKEAHNNMEEYSKQVDLLTKANIDMVDTLKNIHTVLGSKADLFEGDKEMKFLMDALSTFILSSSTIKLGAITNGTH